MSSAVVFDRAQALERLGGDEELLDSVASLFVEESASYRRALVERLEREGKTVAPYPWP